MTTTITLNAAGTPVTLTVDETDHIGRIITTHHDWYERPLLDDAAHRLTTAPDGRIVDVGAHIGNHALYLAAATGRTVHAIEPNPDSFERLQSNISDNPTLRVLPHPVAAGLSFEWGSVRPPRDGNTGTAAIMAVPGGRVPIIPLDDLSDATPTAMIKIDVEDHQGGISVIDVLNGAAATIARDHPLLYVEGDRGLVLEALPDGYEWFGTFGRTPTHGFQVV